MESAPNTRLGVFSASVSGVHIGNLMKHLTYKEIVAGYSHRPIAILSLQGTFLAANVAELYRRKVERLTEALNDPEDRAEAASALRGVIEKIVLTPGAKRGEISAQLVGELRTILAWANDQGDQPREAAGMFPWSFGEDMSVRVGSGPCGISSRHILRVSI